MCIELGKNGAPPPQEGARSGSPTGAASTESKPSSNNAAAAGVADSVKEALDKSTSNSATDIVEAGGIPIHKMVQCLQTLPLFKDFGVDFFEALAWHMSVVTVTKNHYVIRKGDVGQEMYYLAEGKMRVELGDGKVLNEVKQDNFFGEVGVLFSIPRTASVKAVEDSQLYMLTRINLEEVLDMPQFEDIKKVIDQAVQKKLEGFMSTGKYSTAENFELNAFNLTFKKDLEIRYRTNEERGRVRRHRLAIAGQLVTFIGVMVFVCVANTMGAHPYVSRRPVVTAAAVVAITAIMLLMSFLKIYRNRHIFGEALTFIGVNAVALLLSLMTVTNRVWVEMPLVVAAYTVFIAVVLHMKWVSKCASLVMIILEYTLILGVRNFGRDTHGELYAELAEKPMNYVFGPNIIFLFMIMVNGLVVAYLSETGKRGVFLGSHLSEIYLQRTAVEYAKAGQLINAILPHSIAQHLKNQSVLDWDVQNQNLSRKYKHLTTVLSADVVGFTRLSSGMEPGVLVDLLNDLFTQFDNVADDNEIEKIKTIGDCYIAAAGVPDPHPTHAFSMTAFAICIIGETVVVGQQHKCEDLKIRIGIHTGYVIGGVMGVSKVVYDIWGPTMDYTFRMEQTGKEMEIHISHTTRNELVKNNFGSFEYVDGGEVEMTGEDGALESNKTYFIAGRNYESSFKGKFPTSLGKYNEPRPQIPRCHEREFLEDRSFTMWWDCTKPFRIANALTTTTDSPNKAGDTMPGFTGETSLYVKLSENLSYTNLKFPKKLEREFRDDAAHHEILGVNECLIGLFVTAMSSGFLGFSELMFEEYRVAGVRFAFMAFVLVVTAFIAKVPQLLRFYEVLVNAVLILFFMVGVCTTFVLRTSDLFITSKEGLMLTFHNSTDSVRVPLMTVMEEYCQPQSDFIPGMDRRQLITPCLLRTVYMSQAMYTIVCHAAFTRVRAITVATTTLIVLLFSTVTSVMSFTTDPVVHIQDLFTLYLASFMVIMHAYELELSARLGFLKQLLQKEEQEKSRLVSMRTDKLLLNVLPPTVAQKMKEGLATTTRARFMASTLFVSVNVESAVKYSSKKEARLLHEIYKNFDKLVQRNGCEKIKITGYTYMVCCGVPLKRHDHAIGLARTGMAFKKWIHKYNEMNNTSITIAMGQNDGHVVGGVIGSRKFVYDIWGDAVNVASRMCSTCPKGDPNQCFQISKTTKELLEGRFHTRERGTVEIKGKGEMTTYFVDSENKRVSEPKNQTAQAFTETSSLSNSIQRRKSERHASRQRKGSVSHRIWNVLRSNHSVAVDDASSGENSSAESTQTSLGFGRGFSRSLSTTSTRSLPRKESIHSHTSVATGIFALPVSEHGEEDEPPSTKQAPHP